MSRIFTLWSPKFRARCRPYVPYLITRQFLIIDCREGGREEEAEREGGRGRERERGGYRNRLKVSNTLGERVGERKRVQDREKETEKIIEK